MCAQDKARPVAAGSFHGVAEYDVTDETAKAIVELVERISSIRSTDPDIMNIILEDAPGFFTGQRTVEDVSKTIQNRATTVVQER